MRIKITEIEADARELRESNTLAQNFANLLSRCFQSNEPFDDDEESEEEEAQDGWIHRTRGGKRSCCKSCW